MLNKGETGYRLDDLVCGEEKKTNIYRSPRTNGVNTLSTPDHSETPCVSIKSYSDNAVGSLRTTFENDSQRSRLSCATVTESRKLKVALLTRNQTEAECYHYCILCQYRHSSTSCFFGESPGRMFHVRVQNATFLAYIQSSCPHRHGACCSEEASSGGVIAGFTPATKMASCSIYIDPEEPSLLYTTHVQHNYLSSAY